VLLGDPLSGRGDAEIDQFFGSTNGSGTAEGQAQLLFEHLTCPKTFLEFTAEEGADAHCQVGAARLAMGRMYNWLDDTLASHTAAAAPAMSTTRSPVRTGAAG
jgi:hypothetical protein